MQIEHHIVLDLVLEVLLEIHSKQYHDVLQHQKSNFEYHLGLYAQDVMPKQIGYHEVKFFSES